MRIKRFRLLGVVTAIGLMQGLLAAPAFANDDPADPTGPGPGDVIVVPRYTCTPELDIKPTVSDKGPHPSQQGYYFQVILDRATCPGVDLAGANFGFTCNITFHRDNAWAPAYEASGGLSSINASDPDLLICRTWVSKAQLSTADSFWMVRVWASMKSWYPQAPHVNDMFHQESFTVRDDGTIIYRIPPLNFG